MKPAVRTATQIILIMLLAPALCAAGTAKSSGNYELMADTVSSGGSQGLTSGNYGLHNSIGQQADYQAEQTSGDYTLTGGFMGVVDETAPELDITSPAASQTFEFSVDGSRSVSFTGSAFDANGIEWDISFGPGTNPGDTDLESFATGSTTVSAASLGTWNTDNYAGTYTIRLTATDDRGNQAETTVTIIITNIDTISGTIPLQQWVLASTPIYPDPDDPASMFGTGHTYRVYRWNPENEYDPDFGRYESVDQITAADGYWIKVYEPGALNYSYTGTLVDTSTNYIVQVKEGWNQVGTPFNRSFPWGDMVVRYQGQEYDLTTAAVMGLLSDTLQGYDSDLGSWTQHDRYSQMQTQKGYNLRAYEDVELLFDPQAAVDSQRIRQTAKVIRQPFSYRAKISARAANSADVDNYFGTINEADDEFDRFDLEEPFKAPGDSFTSLYFDNKTWERNAGRYTNDIRPPGDSVEKTWKFNVETNESGETVTLTWSPADLPTSRYSFTLVNTDTGERIDMAAQDSYSFVPEGDGVASGHFRIEVGKLEGSQEMKRYTLKPGWNLISVPIEPEMTSAIVQLGDDLPFLNVFQYYDGKMYKPDEADIQAGIGYWVHVSKNSEIDIEGLPVASEIQVPLKPGWNIIGNPFEKPLPWGDNITILTGSQRLTLSQAIANDIIPDKLYRYVDGKYEPVASGTSLQTWAGYFLKVPGDCTIVLKQ